MATLSVALAWSNAPWYSGESVGAVTVVTGVVSVSSTVAFREVILENDPLWLLELPLLVLLLLLLLPTVLRLNDDDDDAGAQAWACCVAHSATRRAVVERRIIIAGGRDPRVEQASRDESYADVNATADGRRRRVRISKSKGETTSAFCFSSVLGAGLFLFLVKGGGYRRVVMRRVRGLGS